MRRICPASWSMSAPRGCIRTANSSRIIVGYVAPPSEQDVAGDPELALPGIRVGRAGLEKAHDLDLRGSAGAVQLEVNALGRVIRELDRQEGMPGEEVGLTIDVGLQQTVLRRLGDESASAVVLDCRNGEVLAMGTNPSFDPSLFNSGVSQAQWAEWAQRPAHAAAQPRDCRVCMRPARRSRWRWRWPGWRRRTIAPGDTVHCPGYLDLGNARFHCWRKGGHGTLDLRGGLKNSCDVYFYETARRVGIDRIAAMAHRLGLGTELEIDLPGARAGFVPTREWRHRPGPCRGTSATPSWPASARATSRSRRCSSRPMRRASPPGARWSRI